MSWRNKRMKINNCSLTIRVLFNIIKIKFIYSLKKLQIKILNLRKSTNKVSSIRESLLVRIIFHLLLKIMKPFNH